MGNRIRVRILHIIIALANDPRHQTSSNLSGADNLWRIRVGDYRVVSLSPMMTCRRSRAASTRVTTRR